MKKAVMKNWYPVIPPAFSFLLSVVLIPLYDHVLDDNLRLFLDEKARDTPSLRIDFKLINGILKGRALQLTCLTELPAFIVSSTTVLDSSHPQLLIALLILMLVFALLICPKVFLKSPDYVALTKFPEKGRPKSIYKIGFTQLSFYSTALAALNLLLIGIIVISRTEGKAP